MGTDGVMKTLYRSAFRLLYAHDDHIIRVVLVFLNMWWVLVDTLPFYLGNTAQRLPYIYQHIAGVISIVGLIAGFLLILLRENPFLINVNYVLTMLFMFNAVTAKILHQPLDIDVGAYAALGIICVVGYMKYNLKQVTTFKAMLKRAEIDVDETSKLMKSGGK
jgi:hypothetical protein